jgi:predicted DNA-binding transcriptional regulator AlpA
MRKRKEQMLGTLDPHAIVRKKNGPKYFGISERHLDDAIASGAVPRPLQLLPGGYACGWLGSTIIAWQRELVARNSKARAA